MVATDPAFDAVVRGAVENMLAHIAEEEGTLLPRLGAALTPATLLQLGIQFEAAKVKRGRPRKRAKQFRGMLGGGGGGWVLLSRLLCCCSWASNSRLPR